MPDKISIIVLDDEHTRRLVERERVRRDDKSIAKTARTLIIERCTQLADSRGEAVQDA